MSSLTDLLLPPAKDSSNGYTSFVMGMVSENGNKDFPGMVKVEFTAWEQGGNISQWMPILSSYAGKKHGLYLVPEVGDIVLVGFLGSLQEQPFILGSFYPAGATPPTELWDEKNANRQFKTKGGITVDLRDEDGKQTLETTTPKGLAIRVSDEDETITLTDGDSKNSIALNCKAGEIAVAADQKITLKAGSCEMTMDGSTGTLTLKCDQLKIEAGQTATIKSANMLTVEGGMLTVEGKQQLALKGSAICELSGGIVKIN